MRLSYLEVENFMAYRGSHVLDLADQGLVQVAGVNLDDPGNNDNGAGKSTILEALTWGLFGEGLPRRQGNSETGVRGDEVIPDGQRGQTRVSVYLSDEETGKDFAVVRWRKYKDGKAKRSSGVTIQEDGQSTTYLDVAEGNKHVCRVLGLDRDIWVRSVIFGQESQFNFCEATAKQRADILTTVMGLEAVDRWLGRCRQEKIDLRASLARQEGSLAQLHAQVEQLRGDDPQAKVAAWEVSRQRRVAEATAELDQIAEQGKATRAEFYAAEVPVVPEFVVAEIDPELQRRFEAAQVDRSRVQMEAGILRRDLSAAQAELSKLQARKPGTVCPTCQQPISEAHQQACESEAAESLRRLDAAFSEAQARETAASLELLEATKLQEAAWEHIRGQQAAYSREHQASKDALTRRAALGKALEGSRNEWVRVERQVRQIAEEANPYLDVQAEWLEKLEALQAEEKQLSEKVGQLQDQMNVLEFWDKEFPRFKTWIFDSVVDTLAAEANRWIKVMTGGVCWIQISTQKATAKGQLRDEIDVRLSRWNPDGTIVSRPYRVWSGGEKRRVALAVDLGLSRLMAQRASRPYTFLALDEVDRHLDDKGREGLRGILEELRKERETTLVITHDAEFRASFDRSLQVCKRGGTSFWEVFDEQAAADNRSAKSASQTAMVQA